MGSSDSGGGATGLADSSVGSIVWVRRRNGSWWPGKILGPDELSATHLMSPRSGTPVKLLGREDASVDWYNLEKSKRVKSFRCGEFSECIEKAEATQGLPAKKREKYARREDAILHALELEKEYVQKKCGKIKSTSAEKNVQNDSSVPGMKELATSSGTQSNVKHKCSDVELLKIHQNGGSVAGNECDSNPACINRGKKGAWLNTEHENVERKPQRTGLSKYGLSTAPSNGAVLSSAAVNGSHGSVVRAAANDHEYPVSSGPVGLQRSADGNFRNPMEERELLPERGPGESLKGLKKQNSLLQSEKFSDLSWQPDDDIAATTSLEDMGKTSRAKRSRAVYSPSGAGAFMNAIDGPNVDLEVPISLLGLINRKPPPGAFVHETYSGSSEDTETDSSDTDPAIPVMEGEMAAYSDMFTPKEAHSRRPNRLGVMGGNESTSSEESDESPLDFHSHFDLRVPTGVSKWQLKGKRNVRSLSRRSLDGSAPGGYVLGDERIFHRSRTHNSCSNYFHNGDDDYEADFVDDGFGLHAERFGDTGHMWRMKSASNQPVGQNLIDWDELTSGDRSIRGFMGERGGYYHPVYGSRPGHGMLMDVDVQVQAQHRGEHVPWVSLMSRLDGKAIIGHPVQVEKLEDGSTDDLLLASGAVGNLSYDNDENQIPHIWRTARRSSNSRVPRPHYSSRSDAYEADRYLHGKKSGPGGPVSKKSSGKKGGSNVTRHPPQRMKKPHKKVSLSASASQKTRTLSSIGIDQKLANKSRHNSSFKYNMEGEMKSLISGPTTVACIPVKLVFSRLLEAIGRPPSGSAYSGNQQ